MRSARATAVLLALAPIAVIAAIWLAVSGPDIGDPPLAAAGASRGAVGDGRSLEGRVPAPIDLKGVDALGVRFRKPPRAALVFDVKTGDVLLRRNPEQVAPIASLTKIMTALLVVAESGPAERVKISKEAVNVDGSRIGVLPRGKRVRLETLLNGLLLVSGNDAAIALAEHVSGSERRFVARMNAQARRWGLKCTHFASPHGLRMGDRSCAHDLAVLTRLAMKEPRIAQIVRQGTAQFSFPIKGRKLFLSGHNPLIRAGFPGAIGLKTGYTDPAGRCFVAVAKRGDRTIGVILLDSYDPGKQSAALLNRAFKTPAQ